MKNLLQVPPTYFPHYDELYAISDLHLGGTKGFQIFNAGLELQKLINHIVEKSPEKEIALLINGDLVDFLAEKPALPFDPIGAIDKLDRIVSDPAFSMVWEALQHLVATPNRFLIINLGNHDLELALPWVRAHLLQVLSNGNQTATGRITFAFDGTGYRCRVGNAQVLCLHGNEVDEWNVADYETIRRLGRDILQGRPVDNWIPNAGTQLVIQIMNGLKSQYPFIDLLKPEAQAVVPTLLALAPEYQDKLSAITATAHRLWLDKVKIATGFLGQEEPDPSISGWNSESSLTNPPDFYFTPDISSTLKTNQQYAASLLEETENRLSENVLPASLIDQDLRGQSLGLSSALIKFINGEDRSEVLREALENLQEDRSFDLKQEDTTYKRLDDQVGENFDFILAGHTHLERALPRQKKKGWYFNSGTWVRLIKLEKNILKDTNLFNQIFSAFKAGTMEALAPFVMQRLTVVKINKDGPFTRGRLQQLNLNSEGDLLIDVPDSMYSL